MARGALPGLPVPRRSATRRSRRVQADRKLKTALRKQLQPKIRVVRKFLAKQIPLAPPTEAEQFAVIDGSAAGILTGLNTEGRQPFQNAAVEAAEALDEVAARLKRRANMGQRLVRGFRKSWRGW
jgi:hypothetical protein